jgi:two-component system, OmpR family, sensor kinase
VLGTAVLAGLVVAAAGAVGWIMARDALVAEFDATLDVQVHALANAVERNEGRTTVDLDALSLPEFTRRRRPDLGAVWDHDGVLLLATPAAIGMWDAMPASRRAAREVALPDGKPARSLVRRIDLPGDDLPITVAVARETDPLQDRLERLAAILVATGTLGALVAAGGMALLVPLLLRPLGRLAGRIAAIDPMRPLPLGPAGLTELEPAMRTLDELLRRLGEQRERERGFVADAAHELRTPLAAVRAALEAPGGGADPLAEVRRLQRTVEDLLALARLDAGAVSVVTAQPVDLTGVVQQRWDLLADLASQRGLTVQLDIADAVVHGDEAKLDAIVRNLLENAVAHADPGSSVTVGLQRDGAGWCLQVENPCASLRPTDATQVRERFWRADHARSGGHAGLGLSIVERLAALCGCRLDIDTSHGRFQAALRIPPGIG